MSETKKALFVILASENGRDNWYPVKHENLPQWLIHPDVLGHLAAGMVACKADDGERGSLWYRAHVALGAQDQARLDAAKRAYENQEAQILMVRPPSDEAFIAIEQSELRH